MVDARHEEVRHYRKEFTKLQNRSDYYRHECAERAARLSRINKLIELTSFLLASFVASASGAALSGFLPTQPVQILAIILSVLIALLHATGRTFFNPGEIVKLFYVAGQFLKIRERAGKGKLHCGSKTTAELSSEYDDLIEEYTRLKRAFIEYIRTPAYYRHKRRRLVDLGGKFTDLPPMKGKSGQKDTKTISPPKLADLKNQGS